MSRIQTSETIDTKEGTYTLEVWDTPSECGVCASIIYLSKNRHEGKGTPFFSEAEARVRWQAIKAEQTTAGDDMPLFNQRLR